MKNNVMPFFLNYFAIWGRPTGKKQSSAATRTAYDIGRHTHL